MKVSIPTYQYYLLMDGTSEKILDGQLIFFFLFQKKCMNFPQYFYEYSKPKRYAWCKFSGISSVHVQDGHIQCQVNISKTATLVYILQMLQLSNQSTEYKQL